MRVIDRVPDDDGDEITVGVLGGKVILDASTVPVHLGADGRDRFAKAWAEAERQAEAHAAAHGTEAAHGG